MARYWRFYWPLALNGAAMVLALQFQNGALARYPDAVTELAVYALASSTFGFFVAGLDFGPQLVNVFARSPRGRRLSHRFLSAWSLLLAAPLAAIAATEAGMALIAGVYGVGRELALRVQEYLLFMLPLLCLESQRAFQSGLLVQAQLTGWVTLLNAVYLSFAISMLIAGFSLGLAPVGVLVGSQIAAATLHWTLSALAVRRRYRAPLKAEHEQLKVRELLSFFVPMTATGFAFAVSRPVLYAFVGRMPDGIASIAALRVAFDFSAMFQVAANQFRHFFVTFGIGDLAAKRRFMALVGVGITATMVLIAATPLSDVLLGDLVGVSGEVLDRTVEAIWVMCLMPAVIVLRNYFHGLLMVNRRTGGMAVGAFLRVAAIAAASQIGYLAGALDHVGAAAILILGFAVETAVVVAGARRTRLRVAQSAA